MELELNTVITERLEAELDVREYIAGYRDVERFEQCCQQCPNYGRRHGCPPHDEDWTARIMRYNRVRILGVKVTPQGERQPLSAANDLIEPVVLEMNHQLLQLEQEMGGMACGFVGKCPYCNEPCSRLNGEPCRHPDKMRPSLEALGFDVTKTASQLLGIEMQWGVDGMMPDYLVLICAVFY